MPPRKPKITLFRLCLILFIIYFPIKWFVINPLRSASIPSVTISDEEFRKNISDISSYSSADLKNFSTTMSYLSHEKYPNITQISETPYKDNLRPLEEEERIQYRAGTEKTFYFNTSNSQYVLEEKSGEPLWKSCIYKISNNKYELLKIPNNCQLGTYFSVYASNLSQNLWVQDGMGFLGLSQYPTTNYFLNDNGSLSRYIEFSN